ncbi:MAG: radical SAM protein [bacterium]|nr:radical SAM protein [bacterium]
MVYRPKYLTLYLSGKLVDRAKELVNRLSNCNLCPQNCQVNRIKGEIGFCKTGRLPVVSSYNLHFGEEPPISGHRGSGTIFFAHCNLACVFCQNYSISQQGEGTEVSIEQLANMMISLQESGAHNINFVSPTHVIAQIVEALVIAVRKGLSLPLVYNSGGYDSLSTLQLLEDIFDIYMPDAKYGRDEIARKYSNAKNYVAVNQTALIEMHRQVGVLKLDAEQVAYRGLLVRHLVLPNGLADSKAVFQFIAEKVSKETYISLMSQYFPANKAHRFPELSRRITREEYSIAERAMRSAGLSNGWKQW